MRRVVQINVNAPVIIGAQTSIRVIAIEKGCCEQPFLGDRRASPAVDVGHFVPGKDRQRQIPLLQQLDPKFIKFPEPIPHKRVDRLTTLG